MQESSCLLKQSLGDLLYIVLLLLLLYVFSVCEAEQRDPPIKVLGVYKGGEYEKWESVMTIYTSSAIWYPCNNCSIFFHRNILESFSQWRNCVLLLQIESTRHNCLPRCPLAFIYLWDVININISILYVPNSLDWPIFFYRKYCKQVINWR